MNVLYDSPCLLMFDIFQVLISVGDVNNESPYFDFDIYYAEIMENAVVGSGVTSVQAKDQDSNSVVIFYLFLLYLYK